MTGSIFMDTQGLYQRRRAFNMSYRNDLTCNLGEIIPVYWQDLIPNSTWNCRVHGLVRFMPLIAPMLSNIDLYVHFWQAPYRILYGEEFTQVITGELESEEWECPYFTAQDIYNYLQATIPSGDTKAAIVAYLSGDGSIFDLLGYDKTLMNAHNAGKINARKFLMYIRLMHDWYANENVEPWINFKDDFDWKELLDYLASEQVNGNLSLKIGIFIVKCYTTFGTAGYLAHQWPKDYFTSALPTLQYGLPTYLPLGDTAPVNLNPSIDSMSIKGSVALDDNVSVRAFPSQGQTTTDLRIVGNLLEGNVDGTYRNVKSIYGSDSNVGVSSILSEDEDGNPIAPFIADLSEATAITINELRITNALQVFKEREMRYGRKPQEYYRGFYGVTPGDLRLQMPKFLGGGRMAVNISDIEQTSQTTSDSPQGNLSGKGTGIAAGFARASTFAPEETFVLGVAWIMPRVIYANTLSRHDTKLNDRFDYYNPSFAHIGEQPVYNYEIYGGDYGTDRGSQEFGYQPRYTEYRFHASELHGDLKGSLSFWTLGRIFNSAPALNANFIYMQPRVLNRIFAVRETTAGLIQRNVILSLQFQCGVIQPLSRYGTPGLMP